MDAQRSGNPRFRYEATGIGSVPFVDPARAVGAVLEHFTHIPFWPQMPRRSFLENMYVQYAEGLPGVVIDETEKTIHIDTGKAYAELEGAFAKYLEGDLEHFRITESRALGFYEFMDAFASSRSPARYVKGHITGPISFALMVTDENKRSVMYDRDYFEVLSKVLGMKARWQIGKLKSLGKEVIIFIDEPYLVSIGSSYVTIDVADAMSKLDQLIAVVKSEGALCGIHCCGNTDWSFMLKRDIDILSFDAYNYTRELLLYGKELAAFVGRGGTVAWGMIPSSDDIARENSPLVVSRVKKTVSDAAAKIASDAEISSIVTPSCGVGSLAEEKALKVFALTKEVAQTLA